MTVDRRPPLPRGLAIVTVLKGMIGTGILGLPYVSSRVHLVIAAPGLIGAAVIGAFSVWRLIQCKSFIAEGAGATSQSRRRVESGSSSSGDEDAESFTYGLGPLAAVGRRAFGLPGVFVAGFGILASQLGFAVSYIDVIVETLSGQRLLGSWLAAATIRLLLFGMLSVLCLLRRLSSLAWLSGAALLIYFYLFCALLYYGGQRLAAGEGLALSEAIGPARMESFGSFLGTAIFAQEAIVISQYVFDEMQLGGEMHDFLPVLFASFGTSGILFTFVGVFGYLSYGDGVKVVFYESFPEGSIAVILGEVVLCLVLFFTYALQMYPVMSFLEAVVLGIHPSKGGEMEFDALNVSDSESSLGDVASSSFRRHAAVAALRCTAVAFTCIVAACVPNLACITGYSGSFAMSAIGFFMPSLCYARLHPGSITLLETFGNILLLMVGVAAIVFGVSATSC